MTIWEYPANRAKIGEAATFCNMVEDHFRGVGEPVFSGGLGGSFTKDAKWYAARHPELYERFIAERTFKRLKGE